MPRVFFSARSLPARVFWLTAGIILLVELLAVGPVLAGERHDWLVKRVAEGQLVEESIKDGADPQMRDTMLRLSEDVAVTVPGQRAVSQPPDIQPAQFGADVHLDKEGMAAGTWRAMIEALGLAAPYVHVFAPCPLPCVAQTEVTVSQSELAHHLQDYVAHAAAFAAILALVTGSLVFLALDRLLVRPMRVLTAGIAGFRRNPGYTGAGELKLLASRGDDEISRAAQELVALQDDLRGALWRNARLAALGTAVAKISHDLRNILTSALLVGDRLHRHGDLMVQQAANTLIPAMERAVELVSRTVDFAEEGPPSLTRSPVAVRALVDELADMLRATDSSIAIDNLLPGTLVLSLDRNQIYRALFNLLRNSVEAGAARITLKLEGENGAVLLVIADNGPGLPSAVIPNLFRPFAGAGRNGGTGLGLTIARDLIRAHGGDLLLRRTGPEGTIFVISLPRELPDEHETHPAAG